MAEAVSRRGGDAAGECREQLMRDRMCGHAHADVVLAAGDEVLREGRTLEDESERPGPEARRERARGRRHVARPGEGALGAVEVDDDRMIARSALHFIQARDGLRAGGISAEPVDRFGGKGDKAALLEKRDRPGDFRLQSLSGGVSSTALVCLRRKSSSLAASALSSSASSETANNAALAAPASPMAKVATGMPFGICTVESNESRPCRCLEGIGTPSTGSVVCAATTPARCAAPPAAAMIAFMPFFLALVAHSAIACGVRCADMAFAS